MSVPTNRRLSRREASSYLEEEHGIIRKPSTLAKLAVIGGGPPFESFNRTPLYRPSELDRWVASIISRLKTSTSDSGSNSNASERGSTKSAPTIVQRQSGRPRLINSGISTPGNR